LTESVSATHRPLGIAARAVERGRDALLRVRALRVALTRLADAADEAAVSANIGTMDDAIKTARDVLEECK
jgi:hypothetical protein